MHVKDYMKEKPQTLEVIVQISKKLLHCPYTAGDDSRPVGTGGPEGPSPLFESRQPFERRLFNQNDMQPFFHLNSALPVRFLSSTFGNFLRKTPSPGTMTLGTPHGFAFHIQNAGYGPG